MEKERLKEKFLDYLPHVIGGFFALAVLTQVGGAIFVYMDLPGSCEPGETYEGINCVDYDEVEKKVVDFLEDQEGNEAVLDKIAAGSGVLDHKIKFSDDEIDAYYCYVSKEGGGLFGPADTYSCALAGGESSP